MRGLDNGRGKRLWAHARAVAVLGALKLSSKSRIAGKKLKMTIVYSLDYV
jgi:hypothetical protein